MIKLEEFVRVLIDYIDPSTLVKILTLSKSVNHSLNYDPSIRIKYLELKSRIPYVPGFKLLTMETINKINATDVYNKYPLFKFTKSTNCGELEYIYNNYNIVKHFIMSYSIEYGGLLISLRNNQGYYIECSDSVFKEYGINALVRKSNNSEMFWVTMSNSMGVYLIKAIN